MSWLNNIFKRKESQVIKREADSEVLDTTSIDLTSIFGTDGSNASLAVKVATVFRCADIVSGTVAALGLNLLKRKSVKIGSVTHYYYVIDGADPLNDVLSVQPNDRLSAFDFWKNTVLQILLQGNAYIIPYFNTEGDVVKMILCSPYSVSHDVTTDTYTVTDHTNCIYTTFEADEILHLRNFSMDGGYTGLSTISYASKVLGIASKTDDQQDDLFKKGSTLRGFISGDQAAVQGFGSLQDDQLETVTDRVAKQENSGLKLFTLPGQMRFNQLSLSPADLQLLDSKRFNVLEICRFFGVHPDKVFQQTSTNYKSSENSQTVFMTDTLNPLLKKIQNECYIKLVPKPIRHQYKIVFDLENYYQADILSKADYYNKMVQAGAMTPNEVRQKEGRVPMAGGDELFISCNVAPIDSNKIRGDQAKTEPTKNNTQE